VPRVSLQEDGALPTTPPTAGYRAPNGLHRPPLRAVLLRRRIRTAPAARAVAPPDHDGRRSALPPSSTVARVSRCFRPRWPPLADGRSRVGEPGGRVLAGRTAPARPTSRRLGGWRPDIGASCSDVARRLSPFAGHPSADAYGRVFGRRRATYGRCLAVAYMITRVTCILAAPLAGLHRGSRCAPDRGDSHRIRAQRITEPAKSHRPCYLCIELTDACGGGTVVSAAAIPSTDHRRYLCQARFPRAQAPDAWHQGGLERRSLLGLPAARTC
jgi:hypothetical protein